MWFVPQEKAYALVADALELKPETIIKMGSVSCQVTSVCTRLERSSAFDEYLPYILCSNNAVFSHTCVHCIRRQNDDNATEDGETPLCYICWEGDNSGPVLELDENGERRAGGESGNPLIVSPCACSGSSKYVHLECLHHWIERYIIMFHGITPLNGTVSTGSGICSVCKSPFPDHFEARPPFIKLRVVRHQRGVTWTSQRHFLVSFAGKNRVVIGKRNCDLVLPDPSVSKVHACIEFDGETFNVRDCGSSTGTFFRVDGHLALKPDDVTYVKFGHTMLSIAAKQKKGMFVR
jgi:hypothetical protein